MHLHGHDFLLIAEGVGVFDESVLETAQLINPTRRDVVTMPASGPGAAVPGGFIVIAFPLNNPGVWVGCLSSALTSGNPLSYRLPFVHGLRNAIC